MQKFDALQVVGREASGSSYTSRIAQSAEARSRHFQSRTHGLFRDEDRGRQRIARVFEVERSFAFLRGSTPVSSSVAEKRDEGSGRLA